MFERSLRAKKMLLMPIVEKAEAIARFVVHGGEMRRYALQLTLPRLCID